MSPVRMEMDLSAPVVPAAPALPPCFAPDLLAD